MIEDDHYIVNANNTRIDTSVFETNVINKLSHSTDKSTNEILEEIYALIFLKTDVAPEQPSDEQLICRYLTPEKFLKFLDSQCIDFPSANKFNDQLECRIPEDYDHAVLRVLNTVGISAEDWYEIVKSKAAEWNVSCWTQLNNYFDDHLMWHSYAGGSQGIGITIRYGQLKRVLSETVKKIDVNCILHSGSVNYETLSQLPFNKHYIFRNENEVRFVFKVLKQGAQSISIKNVFSSFGVRISPAATLEYHDMIRRLWISFGGEDRIQWPQ